MTDEIKEPCLTCPVDSCTQSWAQAEAMRTKSCTSRMAWEARETRHAQDVDPATTIATLRADLDALRADAAEGREVIAFYANPEALEENYVSTGFNDIKGTSWGELDYHISDKARDFLATPNPGAELLAELSALRAEHEAFAALTNHCRAHRCSVEMLCAEGADLIRIGGTAHAKVERLRKGEGE